MGAAGAAAVLATSTGAGLIGSVGGGAAVSVTSSGTGLSVSVGGGAGVSVTSIGPGLSVSVGGGVVVPGTSTVTGVVIAVVGVGSATSALPGKPFGDKKTRIPAKAAMMPAAHERDLNTFASGYLECNRTSTTNIAKSAMTILISIYLSPP